MLRRDFVMMLVIGLFCHERRIDIWSPKAKVNCDFHLHIDTLKKYMLFSFLNV